MKGSRMKEEAGEDEAEEGKDLEDDDGTEKCETNQNQRGNHRADGREGLVYWIPRAEGRAVQVEPVSDVALCQKAQTGYVLETQQRHATALS